MTDNHLERASSVSAFERVGGFTCQCQSLAEAEGRMSGGFRNQCLLAILKTEKLQFYVLSIVGLREGDVTSQVSPLEPCEPHQNR